MKKTINSTLLAGFLLSSAGTVYTNNEWISFDLAEKLYLALKENKHDEPIYAYCTHYKVSHTQVIKQAKAISIANDDHETVTKLAKLEPIWRINSRREFAASIAAKVIVYGGFLAICAGAGILAGSLQKQRNGSA